MFKAIIMMGLIIFTILYILVAIAEANNNRYDKANFYIIQAIVNLLIILIAKIMEMK